jgi:hypothetical protein
MRANGTGIGKTMVARVAAAWLTMTVACGGAAGNAGPLPRARSPEELMVAPPPPPKVEGSLYWGTVKEIQGTVVVLTLRDGKTINVDIADAQKRGFSVVPTVGANLVVNGTVTNGVLVARIVNRAKGPATWGADVTQ